MKTKPGLRRDSSEPAGARAPFELPAVAEACLNASTAGTVLLDGSGRIRLINPAACELLQCAAADVTGEDWLTCFAPEERITEYRNLFERHVEAGGGQLVTAGLDRLRTTTGEPRYVSCRLTTLQEPGGNSLGFVCSIEDRGKLRKLRPEFDKTRKMALLGRLAGGVAHDINNLLQIIRGNAQMLHFETDSGAEPIDEILDAADRGARLLRRMLAFASRQRHSPVEFEIGGLVTEIVELLRGSLNKKIRIAAAVEVEAATVIADPSETEIALLSLAVNAGDAMPDGGTLTIACRRVTTSNADVERMPAARTGDYVRLSVSDTGPGTVPRGPEHDVELSATTGDRREDAEAELSIVHGLAAGAGGFVNVVSECGKGTTVEVYLPCTGCPN